MTVSCHSIQSWTHLAELSLEQNEHVRLTWLAFRYLGQHLGHRSRVQKHVCATGKAKETWRWKDRLGLCSSNPVFSDHCEITERSSQRAGKCSLEATGSCPNKLWNNPFLYTVIMYYSHWFNEELIGQQWGRTILGKNIKLRGRWEEGHRQQESPVRCRGSRRWTHLAEKGTTMWQSVDQKYGFI